PVSRDDRYPAGPPTGDPAGRADGRAQVAHDGANADHTATTCGTRARCQGNRSPTAPHAAICPPPASPSSRPASPLRELVHPSPVPVLTDALGFHHHSPRRLALAGITWSRTPPQNHWALIKLGPAS